MIIYLTVHYVMNIIQYLFGPKNKSAESENLQNQTNGNTKKELKDLKNDINENKESDHSNNLKRPFYREFYNVLSTALYSLFIRVHDTIDNSTSTKHYSSLNNFSKFIFTNFCFFK